MKSDDESLSPEEPPIIDRLPDPAPTVRDNETMTSCSDVELEAEAAALSAKASNWSVDQTADSHWMRANRSARPAHPSQSKEAADAVVPEVSLDLGPAGLRQVLEVTTNAFTKP